MAMLVYRRVDGLFRCLKEGLMVVPIRFSKNYITFGTPLFYEKILTFGNAGCSRSPGCSGC